MSEKSLQEIIEEQRRIQVERGAKFHRKGWDENMMQLEYLRELQRTDPEYAKYWNQALRDGIAANIDSYKEAAQAREADPEFREKRVGALRETLATKEYKQNHAAGIERMKKDPNWRAATKRANQDPKRRAKHSASVAGEKHSQFKGYMVGTNKKTGEEIRFAGAAALEAAGFIYAHVCCCVNGKPGFKSHKGYTWRREE